MQKKTIYNLAITGAIALTAIIPFAAGAQTTSTTSTSSVGAGTSTVIGRYQKHTDFNKSKNGVSRGVNGMVSAINGSSFVVTNSKGVAYTIDATNAKINSGRLSTGTVSLSNIQVGDKVSVLGTVTGNNVVAKTINDITLAQNSTFNGKVTAVSGSTLTVLNGKNVSESVDVSQAKLSKVSVAGKATILSSDIAVGDSVEVWGTKSGLNFVATDLQDMGVRVGGKAHSARVSSSTKVHTKKTAGN